MIKLQDLGCPYVSGHVVDAEGNVTDQKVVVKIDTFLTESFKPKDLGLRIIKLFKNESVSILATCVIGQRPDNELSLTLRIPVVKHDDQIVPVKVGEEHKQVYTSPIYRLKDVPPVDADLVDNFDAKLSKLLHEDIIKAVNDSYQSLVEEKHIKPEPANKPIKIKPILGE